jgi:hypothetical protein
MADPPDFTLEPGSDQTAGSVIRVTTTRCRVELRKSLFVWHLRRIFQKLIAEIGPVVGFREQDGFTT